MIDVMYEISKEDYDKAKKEDAYALISESVQMGYGAYAANVFEKDGKFYLYYRRGDLCD